MKLFDFNNAGTGNRSDALNDSDGILLNDIENQFNPIEMELINQRVNNNRKQLKTLENNRKFFKNGLNYNIFIPRFVNKNNKMFYYVVFLMIIGLIGVFLNFGLGIRLTDEETNNSDGTINNGYIDNGSTNTVADPQQLH